MKILILKVAALSAATWFATSLVAVTAPADHNWGHWRGPTANGVAPNGDPPIEWSETKNVKWKVPIPGRAHASPVVWGEKIFVLTAINTGKRPEGAAAPTPTPPPAEGQGRRGGRGFGGGPPTELHQFVVMCLDRNTGKILWQKVAREVVPHEGHQPTASFASGSPVADGQQLYAFFGSFGLYCYDFDGNLKWERDFGKMQTFLGFGEGSTPVVHDGKLIVNWDHEGDGDFIATLDAKTGKDIWKTPRSGRTTWNTPRIIVTAKQTQVVVPGPSPHKTRAYDLANGQLIWECDGQANGNVIPAPTVGHGLVFVMSGQGGNSVQAIRYDKAGDLTGTDSIAWSLSRNAPHVPSSLLYDDLLYFFSGNGPVLSLYEAATGKALIEAQRLNAVSSFYASPVGAAGRIYLIDRNGSAVVIKKGAQLEVLATNKLDDNFDASPAIVGKEMFLRGYRNLYCLAQP